MTCDCAANTRYRNFGIRSTSDGGLYHRKKKDLSSLDFTLINVARFKTAFCYILPFLTKNLMWMRHPLKAFTTGTRLFLTMNTFDELGLSFFIGDLFSYEWLLSIIKDYLYLINFNVGNLICCWICMYITHSYFGSGSNGSPFLVQDM